MKLSISASIMSSIIEKKDAKKFLKELADQFTSNKKVEITTLLTKLVSMRYKGKGNISEYIMKMFNLVTRLRTLKLEMSESVNLVSIFLPVQFTHFNINYNTRKEK